MAHQKYTSVSEVIKAIEDGLMTRISCSRMIQYYKNRNPDRAEMYREAMKLTREVK